MTLDKEKKREIINEYKQKTITGGVYKITNRQSGKCLIKGEIDLLSFKNRFDFSMKVGSCLLPKLQSDYERLGSDAFDFEILQEIKKKEEETSAQFREKLKKLEEEWNERYLTVEKY